MSEQVHTPGPWRAEMGVQNTFFIRAAAEGGTICLVDTEKAEVEIRGVETVIRRVVLPHGPSNAHLIAAAPDMLAALHEIEEFLDNQADVDDGNPNAAMRLLVELRAAIAKAEGRS